MPKKSKKEIEDNSIPTLKDVSEGPQTGGQIRAKKQAPRGKNVAPRESSRYARARIRSM